MSSLNRKRIVHNTAMLYLRMILAMAVGLYASRVLLNVLGVEDFGVYHVIAGFVILLGFMQGAMTSSTQRYFSFDLGENHGANMLALFNTSLQIHAVLAIGIGIIAETIGYWFLINHLTISPARMAAAVWTYHLSVITFVVTVMTVPLMAMLMADERMGLFAIISIAEIVLKLAAVLVLPFWTSDKLVSYSIMLLCVSLFMLAVYTVVNVRLYSIRITRMWHPTSFKAMFGFLGWSAWGYLAAAMSSQGNNVLLNVFFGPTVNAGRSVSQQANGALNSLVQNVQAAINPQIVKQYASGNLAAVIDLVCKASKYNFYLLLVVVLPVFFNVEPLLNVWLVEVPPYASVFLKLIIVASLIDSLSLPLITMAQATGKIRLYQCVVGGVLLLNVPISYVALIFWKNPVAVIWSTILLAVAALFARIFILRKLIAFSGWMYAKSVLGPVSLVAITAGGISIFLHGMLSKFGLICSLFGLLGIVIVIVFLMGLNREEKKDILALMAGGYRKFI